MSDEQNNKQAEQPDKGESPAAPEKTPASLEENTAPPEGLDAFMQRAAFPVYRRAERILSSSRQAADAAREALAQLWISGPPTPEEDLAMALYRACSRSCLSRLAGQIGLSNEWLQHMEQRKGISPEELDIREQLVDWLTPLAPEDQALLTHHYIDGVDRDRNAKICEISRSNIDRRLALFAEQVSEHLPADAPNPFGADSQPAGSDHFAAERRCLAIDTTEAETGEGDEAFAELITKRKDWQKEQLETETLQVAAAILRLRAAQKNPLKRALNKSILIPALVLTLLVGLVFFAAWPKPEEPVSLAPGKDPFSLQLMLSREYKMRELKPGERVVPGDIVAYQVNLAKRAFVVVAGLGEEGKARFPFDKGPLNWPVQAKKQILPIFTHIDHSRAKERIFVFFCDQVPVRPESLLEMLEQAYPFNREGRRDLSQIRMQEAGDCRVLSELVSVDLTKKQKK